MTSKLNKPEIICIKSAEVVNSDTKDWIAIGQIRKTVGLKGWLRVSLMTDFPDRFEPGEELTLRKHNGSSESVMVSESKPHYSENAVDVLLEGIDNCDSAASYVNRLVVIPKEEREELDSDDEFYPDELEGFRVLSPENEDCGKVNRMEADAPCPYLVISAKDSVEIMVPFLRKFIGSIDKNNKSLKLVEPISFHIPIE